MMNLTVLGLCAGRYELPVNGYIFGNIVDPMDMHGMMNTVHEALQNVESLELYVTGLTVACTTVIRYCINNLIPVKLMHFDRESGEYYPQVILSEDDVFVLKNDHGVTSI